MLRKPPHSLLRRRHVCTSAPTLISLASKTVEVGKPPRTLVNGLSLTIRERERWALLGENGCGKSVTAQLLGRSLRGDGATASAAAASTIASAASIQADTSAAFVSFESHRRLLQDEEREYRSSRFDVVHKRATCASFLFPEFYPEDPEDDTAQTAAWDASQGRTRTRLSPLPVPYDADGAHPQLAQLEAAATSGYAGQLLRSFGLLEQRHRPIFALSTGEARKLMLIHCLLTPPQLLVLDEAFDGLDERSRAELTAELTAALEERLRRSSVVLITHYVQALSSFAPTHALLLGQGDAKTGYEVGEWGAMRAPVESFFERAAGADAPAATPAATPRAPRARAVASAGGAAEPLIEFRDATIQYPGTAEPVFSALSWTVREGEKWVVAGGNGSGKSTLVELITGDNVLGYRAPMWLFGKRKGSGESVWDIKRQLGVLSTETHMAYVDYADPEVRSFARSHAKVTTWEVVCSGLFDSVGLYKTVTKAQERAARQVVARFGLDDLVPPPPQRTAAAAAAAGAGGGGGRDFFHLSHGQQKLVLLCRALVKAPRLLLLDEPSHGLSADNRDRLIQMLGVLDDDPTVAVIYVTHRRDEIDALQYDHVLAL